MPSPTRRRRTSSRPRSRTAFSSRKVSPPPVNTASDWSSTAAWVGRFVDPSGGGSHLREAALGLRGVGVVIAERVGDEGHAALVPQDVHLSLPGVLQIALAHTVEVPTREQPGHRGEPRGRLAQEMASSCRVARAVTQELVDLPTAQILAIHLARPPHRRASAAKPLRGRAGVGSPGRADREEAMAALSGGAATPVASGRDRTRRCRRRSGDPRATHRARREPRCPGTRCRARAGPRARARALG